MKKKTLSYLIPTLILLLLGIAVFSGQVQLTTKNTSSAASGRSENQFVTTLTGELLTSPYGTKEELIKLLSQAKYTIRIRIYLLDDEQIFQLLKNKARLGVSVKIILENEVYGEDATDSYEDVLEEIAGTEIQVITDQKLWTNFMHAKTVIVDDTTYLISTANMTYPSFFLNREYRFVGHDSDTIQALTDLFEHDRTAKNDEPDLPDHLRACPYTCRSSLTEFLQLATSSILIEAQYLEDPSTTQVLQEKIQQWVDVKLLRWKYQSLQALWSLERYSRILAAPNVHAKAILIDDRLLYIGSMNLSTNAIENNREIGIIIADPQVIRRFEKQFLTDRETAIWP